MSQKIFGSGVPVTVPGEKLTPDDMRWVTEDDWADIQSLARRYCRTVDATRSRKRMDGSATVSHHGHAPYGTDDISDDVTQDAFLIFAQRQREIMTKHVIASVDIDTRLPDSWQYVRRDGQTMMATRQTLMRWAVRDAAARNGYRVDIPPDEVDDTPDSQVMRGVRRVDHVARAAAVAASASQQSEAIWRMAYGTEATSPPWKGFSSLRVRLMILDVRASMPRSRRVCMVAYMGRAARSFALVTRQPVSGVSSAPALMRYARN